jgi:hypothetical protein
VQASESERAVPSFVTDWRSRERLLAAHLGEIETALAAFDNRPLCYDPADLALAGAFVSIAADRALPVDRGYVRPEDEPSPDTDGAVRPPDGAEPPISARQATVISVRGTGAKEEREEDTMRPMPERLVSELTAHRTLPTLRVFFCLISNVATASTRSRCESPWSGPSAAPTRPGLGTGRRQHPFGTLEAWMGATHFKTRTLDKVRTEMSLHVLAHNLKRVVAMLGPQSLIEAIRA